MTGALAYTHIHLHGPHIDWAGLSPLEALLGGSIVVLLIGLLPSERTRARGVPAVTLIALAVALVRTVVEFHHHSSLIAGALRWDELASVLTLIFVVTGIAVVVLTIRAAHAEQAGHGEHHALLLASIAGMVVLVSAQNTVALFLGLELLSIPLYVLCASELLRATSLESGLKYLVVGSVGSATLLYGLALLYGATGSTDFAGIAHGASGGGISHDVLMLTGIGLAIAGLAFKSSVAPFHQWTPDVYEGAPTPVTAFMAVATKAAALGVFLRLFDVALIDSALDWGPLLAALAAVTIVVGNVGALGQSSLKRMLAWSGVAQAGYMLAGVVVASKLGLKATVFYLLVYLLMNMGAFAVVIARERETPFGDDIRALAGLGSSRPLLAWPMTIAMLALAGIPATAGFVGKVYLIDAAVDGGYTWLGVTIVIGSMISLGYYLRVIAAMWMGGGAESLAAPPPGPRPAIAGGSPEADAESRHFEVAAVAVLFAAATIFFGIVPSPLFYLARDAGSALGLL